MDVNFGLISSHQIITCFYPYKFSFRPHKLYMYEITIPLLLVPLPATFMATHLLTTSFSLLTNRSLKQHSLFHIAKSTPLSLSCFKKRSILCNPTTPSIFNSTFLQMEGTHENSISRHFLTKSAQTDSGNTSTLSQNVSFYLYIAHNTLLIKGVCDTYTY